MLGKRVLIDYEGNFYTDMIGKVIEEHPQTVTVKIDFNGDLHEVTFYKEQVELIK